MVSMKGAASMHFSLVTLFPEFFDSPLGCGLLQRARDTGVVDFSFHNPRDFATDPHRTVDDRPYGGGPGMVLMPGPLAATLESIGHLPANQAAPVTGVGPALPSGNASGRLIYLSPRGKRLTQSLAQELAQEERLTLVCGRYEGIDSRIEEIYPVECVSVGDVVLNGGEAAALCLIEAVGRLLPGFMGHEQSGDDESFSNGLLEYPHFTRPETFAGIPVPEVLRSGDHGAINRYRREERLRATLAHRPDLLATAPLGPEDKAHLRTLPLLRPGRNLFVALVHYPVLDKQKKTAAVSLTNLDIHDIARCACSYGIGGSYFLTPVEDQQRLLQAILRHWTEGKSAEKNPDRKQALSRLKGLALIEDAVRDIMERTGMNPLVATTSALVLPAGKKKRKGPPEMLVGEMRERLASQPVLLLFGTGHGLAPEAMALAGASLPPIRWHGEYNHLSVRSAVAIMLDRLLDDWY